MDDKSKETLTRGGVGALIGGTVGGPVGAAVGGIAGALLGSHERKHNKALRKTVYELDGATNGEAKIYVDHIDPSPAEPGGTQNRIKDVSGAPDIITIAQRYSNLIIEVETIEAINQNSTHVIKQLNDFQTQGFKRVLVVPQTEVDDFMEWCETHERNGRINREVTITTPESIEALL